jgi:cytidylate kinase
MREQTRERPEILAAAERTMHAWALSKELKDREDRSRLAKPAAQRALKYVAISREIGAGGSDVGQALSQRLGWPVFDRNLLDCIAEHFNLPRMMLDLVDETHASWVYDVLGTWMDRKIVPHEKFVACLSRIIAEAARRGNGVFVGRGAQFLLPRQDTLTVRLIASPEYRLRQIMSRLGMNEPEARTHIREVECGRREFVERFFHRDLTDPHLYDLVINVERSGIEKAVNEIAAAIGR